MVFVSPVAVTGGGSSGNASRRSLSAMHLRRKRVRAIKFICKSILAIAVFRLLIRILTPANYDVNHVHDGGLLLSHTGHVLNSNSLGLLPPFNSDMEHSLQQYMHQQRLAFINESSVVQYERLYEHFFNETIFLMQRQVWLGNNSTYCPYINDTTRDDFLYIFTTDLHNDHRNDILSGMLCCAMDGFFATGGVKRHVLFSLVNSNRGEFSDYVPNRTYVPNLNLRKKHDECGGRDKYYQYLNHPNVSLVVTMQHQHFDHPKVLSLPLGQQSNAAGALQQQAHLDWAASYNRTNLLLISCDASPTRKPIIQKVIANFDGNLTNKKDPARVDEYLQQLSTSKYILSPSGMGWDCYRTWEALILGCIPILETYYRQDGLYRTYDDLPVLWVDHYDNVTPSLLEREYPKILLRAKEYNFEKLTNQWWIDLINSHRN